MPWPRLPRRIVASAAFLWTTACADGGSPEGAARTFEGELAYLADSARFVDCDSGESYPVVGPARPELERAYLEVASWPGDWILARLRGRIEQQPAMEGEGVETSLVVTAVEAMDDRRWCRFGSSAAAAGTYVAHAVPSPDRGPAVRLRLARDGRALVVTWEGRPDSVRVERGFWALEDESSLRVEIVSGNGRPLVRQARFLVHREGSLLHLGEAFGAPGLKLQREPAGEDGAPDFPLAPRSSELAHLTYPGILDVPVQLTDGRFEGEPFVPGGASRPVVHWVRDLYATGDLDGDATQEAAVLLSQSSGGSGTRIHLAVVSVREGRPVSTGAVLVGDRPQIQGMEIEDEEIVLELVQRGPEDAACCPTQRVRRGWTLRDGSLVPTGSVVTGVLSLDAIAGDWLLTHLAWKEPVRAEVELTLTVDGAEVSGSTGCNRFTGSLQETSPGEVEAGPIGSTRRVCPGDHQELERLYLERLGSVVKYGFLSGKLALTWRLDERVGVLLFARRR